MSVVGVWRGWRKSLSARAKFRRILGPAATFALQPVCPILTLAAKCINFTSIFLEKLAINTFDICSKCVPLAENMTVREQTWHLG